MGGESLVRGCRLRESEIRRELYLFSRPMSTNTIYINMLIFRAKSMMETLGLLWFGAHHQFILYQQKSGGEFFHIESLIALLNKLIGIDCRRMHLQFY